MKLVKDDLQDRLIAFLTKCEHELLKGQDRVEAAALLWEVKPQRRRGIDMARDNGVVVNG